MVINKNAFVFAFILLSIVLASSVVSAETYTVVAGKVYTSDYTQSLADAKVTIVCGSIKEEPITKNDGTYAAKILSSLCNINSEVAITASKDGYDSSSANVTVTLCDGNAICETDQTENTTIDYIALANPNLKESAPAQPTSSGGGGSSRRSTGSSVIVITSKNLTNQIVVPEVPENDSAQEEQITLNEDESAADTEESFLSKITGAFAGPGAAGSWIIVIIFLAIVIAAYIFVKRKTNTSNKSFYQN